MSIMDFFKATPATPAASKPTPAGNIPVTTPVTGAAAAGTAPNGTQPPGSTTPTAGASPLDQFADLWNTDPNAATTNGQPLFNVNQEQLLAAARTQDFKKFITPEQLQAISQGGESAMNAFASALNEVSQQSFAMNALATTKLIEGAMGRNNTNMEAKLPGIIKQHGFSDSLRAENPAFSHAAAQPIIQALQQTLVTKYPNATQAELRTMATQYLGSFADAVKPAPTVTPPGRTTNAAGETDWSSFLN
jgi:hypothetical protein